MAALLNDPAELRDRVDRLGGRRGAGQRDGLELEALAEACFRLAVHPATPAEESLELLKRAMRLDGANPKLAYHVARLYFAHGQLDRAAQWLERALKICPTSHRIWVHASMLQRELNARYRADVRYEPDALRTRATALAEAVKQGSDRIDPALLDFEPPLGRAHLEQLARSHHGDRQPAEAVQEAPEAPMPKRLDSPGRCRWSGVNDLLAEELLEGEPTRSNRDRLLPLLDVLAESSGRRQGGVAAFAIAGIEWLVAGYPVGSVRQALERLPADEADPAAALLELACTLFEADEEEAPRRIAAALDEGRIPPVLAAVLHHRRALWRPMRFRTLGMTYRAARDALENDPGAEAAAERLERLVRAAGELEAERAAPLADAGSDGAAVAADPAERVRALAARAEEMARERHARLSRLNELKATKEQRELEPIELSEVSEIADFAATLAIEPEASIAELNAIKEAGVIQAEEDIAAIEPAIDTFGSVSGRRPFRRALQQLLPAEGVTEAAAPAEQTGAAPAEAPQAPASLEQALEDVDRRVRERFADANASFDAYSPQSLRFPPIRGLRTWVLAREAEALYRLGDRSGARQAWNRILREDPLSLGALHNVAVADTLGPESHRQLESWRRYAETLYYYDVLAGSPHPNASARAEFHSDAGGAYAPDVLSGERTTLEALEIDETTLVTFLSSPTRVRLFVGHKLLEVLNAKLAFASPPLILGVRRSEGEELREKARAELLAFVDEAAALVPERVRGAFAELCRQRVEAASRACRSARRITLEGDPSYESELGAQVELVRSVCDLKYRIFVMIMAGKNAEKVMGLTSFDFLNELARLDRIPIASSPEFLRKAQEELRVGEDPSAFADMMRVLRRQVFIGAANAGHGERVLPAVLDCVAAGEESHELAMLAAQIATMEAQRTDSSEALDAVVESLCGWLDRARASEEEIAAVTNQLDEAAVAIVLAPLGDLNRPDVDWRAVADAMTAAIDDRHPAIAGGSAAYFMRLMARSRLLESARHDRDELIRQLAKVKEDAEVVVERSEDANQVEQARALIGQADEVLAQAQA